MSKRASLACVLVLGSLGCAATVGTNGAVYIPKDSAKTCTAKCSQIGMSLAAVAIMANNVGCVCQSGPADKAVAGAAPTAGMATITMLEAEAEAQAAQQRRNQTMRHR